MRALLIAATLLASFGTAFADTAPTERASNPSLALEDVEVETPSIALMRENLRAFARNTITNPNGLNLSLGYIDEFEPDSVRRIHQLFFGWSDVKVRHLEHNCANSNAVIPIKPRTNEHGDIVLGEDGFFFVEAGDPTCHIGSGITYRTTYTGGIVIDFVDPRFASIYFGMFADSSTYSDEEGIKQK